MRATHDWSTVFAVVLLLGFILVGTSTAQDSLGIHAVGRLPFWSEPYDLEMSGTIAGVCGWQTGIHLLDVSNPPGTLEEASIPWEPSGIVGRIAMAGSRLFVAQNDGDLVIFDIATPSQPTEVGRWSRGYELEDVWVRDTVVAALDVEGELIVLNVAHPAQPVSHAEFYAGWPVGFINGYLCTIAGAQGLQVWDLSDLDDPQLVATSTGGENYSAAIVAGHVAYCALITGGVRLIDLQNPLAPVTGAMLDASLWYQGLTVSGNYLYLSRQYGTGVSIWNVSNSTSPVFVAAFDEPRLYSTLRSSGSYLCASTPNASRVLSIYDLTNPALPQPRATFGTQADITHLRAAGNQLYASDWTGGLQVFDVTNASQPAELALLDTLRAVMDVAVSGAHAYLATHALGFKVVDIATPSQPAIIGSIDTLNGGVAVAMAGNYAYVLQELGDDAARLAAVDVSNPAVPVITGVQDFLAYVEGMAPVGNWLYEVGSSGMMVFSLANPAQPVTVGMIAPEFSGLDVAVAEDMLVIARGIYGWSILDLTQPSQPQQLYNSGYDADNPPVAVDAQGHFAYVFFSDNTVRIFDVQSPASPLLVGQYPLYSGYGEDLVASGTRLYLASQQDGLVILDCSEALNGTGISRPTPSVSMPTTLRLADCFPNPFNPSTTVGYDVPVPSHVRLAVFDVTGREVAVLADGLHTGGHYSVRFNATALPSGTYFCRLTSGNQTQMKRLTLLK